MQRQSRSRIFDTILQVDAGALAHAAASSAPMPAERAPAPPQGELLSEMHVARERGQRAEEYRDYETAAAEFERALRAAGSPDVSPVDQIQLYLAQGRSHQHLQRFSEARMAYEQAQHLILACSNPASLEDLQVETEVHFATLEFALHEVQKAEEHLHTALRRSQQSVNARPQRLSRIRQTLASIYVQADLPEKAMEVALEDIAFLENCEEPVLAEQMRAFQLLAALAYHKGEREAAMHHLLEAYRLAETSASQAELIELEVLLATLYSFYGHDREAAEWYQAALQRQEVASPDAHWPRSLLSICLGQVQARLDRDSSTGTLDRSLADQLHQLYVAPSVEPGSPQENKAPA